MANVNSTTISGNLTRDPEVRWLSEDGASAIVSFGIAVNRRRKKDDEFIEETSFFNVECFGGFAILVKKKMRKADSATIQGRLEQQQFEKDGQNREKVVIVADQIDSEAFFRSADENATVEVGSTGVTTTPAPGTLTEAPEAAPVAAATKDDIPF